MAYHIFKDKLPSELGGEVSITLDWDHVGARLEEIDGLSENTSLDILERNEDLTECSREMAKLTMEIFPIHLSSILGVAFHFGSRKEITDALKLVGNRLEALKIELEQLYRTSCTTAKLKATIADLALEKR